jgi:hypothetical protein
MSRFQHFKARNRTNMTPEMARAAVEVQTPVQPELPPEAQITEQLDGSDEIVSRPVEDMSEQPPVAPVPPKKIRKPK